MLLLSLLPEMWIGQGMKHRTIEDLYQSHSQAAMQLALVLTAGERQAAEDLVHEAFVRLLGRFGNFNTPSFVEPYLNRTIVNLARSTARRSNQERNLLRQGRVPSGDEPVFSVEDRAEIWEFVLALPVRQRAAIFLRYYADMPLGQVADSLNCTESAVKSLIHRALQQLRDKEVLERARD